MLSTPFYEWGGGTWQAWSDCTLELKRALVLHCFGQRSPWRHRHADAEEESQEARLERSQREWGAWRGGIKSQIDLQFGGDAELRPAGLGYSGTFGFDGDFAVEVDVGRQIARREWSRLHRRFQLSGWSASLSYQGVAIELAGGPGGRTVDLLPANATFFDKRLVEFPSLFRTGDRAWAEFQSQEFFDDFGMAQYAAAELKSALRHASRGNELPLKVSLLDRLILRAGEGHLAYTPEAHAVVAVEFLGGVLRSMSRMDEALHAVTSDLAQDIQHLKAWRRRRILAGVRELRMFARDPFEVNRLYFSFLVQSAVGTVSGAASNLQPRPFSAYSLFTAAHAGRHAPRERQAAVKAATAQWWRLGFHGRLPWYEAEARGCQEFEEQVGPGGGQVSPAGDFWVARFAWACQYLRDFTLSYLPRTVVEAVAGEVGADPAAIRSNATLFSTFLRLYVDSRKPSWSTLWNSLWGTGP